MTVAKMNSKFEFEIPPYPNPVVDWIVQGNALHYPRMFEGFKILVENSNHPKFEFAIRIRNSKDVYFPKLFPTYGS
jgi:hypothetical protein